ncbi:MAG: hypothetical protein QNJ53_28845, partial [Pleurocapsa sp. MO_192.B19]|nr:hypothetical protein [Pleurocapsa sp. MO_192.B19]
LLQNLDGFALTLELYSTINAPVRAIIILIIPKAYLKEVHYAYTVGMPSGRFLPLDLGMYTLLAGIGFQGMNFFSESTKSPLPSGFKITNPSTPGVFFPWFSCVHLLTARSMLL